MTIRLGSTEWVDQDVLYADDLNDTFDEVYDDFSDGNSSVLSQLFMAGEIDPAAVDNVIYNSSLGGISNNPSINWSTKLTGFDSMVMINQNSNRYSNNSIELAYLNTVGNLIAGRFNLSTEIFTQTHEVLSTIFPEKVTGSYPTIVASYNVCALSENNDLLFGYITIGSNASGEEGSFSNLSIYDTSGNEVTTASTFLVAATTGGSINRVYVTGLSAMYGYYTSGSNINTAQLLYTKEDDTSERKETYIIKLSYNGTSLSSLVTFNRSISDLQADIYAWSIIYISTDDMYIKFHANCDDGGSVDEEGDDMFLYKLDLSTYILTTVVSLDDGSHESAIFTLSRYGDLLYSYMYYKDNSGNKTYIQKIYLDGTEIYSGSIASSTTVNTASFSAVTMPRGVEYDASFIVNGVTQISQFKAYNRIDNTNTDITTLSSLGAINTNYWYLDVSSNKYFTYIDSTSYMIYNNTIGEIVYNDVITAISIGDLYSYFTPFINTFWSDFKTDLITNISLNNGTTTVELDGNTWQKYNDTIEEIDLQTIYNHAPLQSFGNIGYYIIYNK